MVMTLHTERIFFNIMYNCNSFSVAMTNNGTLKILTSIFTARLDANAWRDARALARTRETH
jgi:hypothetical protein